MVPLEGSTTHQVELVYFGGVYAQQVEWTLAAAGHALAGELCDPARDSPGHGSGLTYRLHASGRRAPAGGNPSGGACRGPDGPRAACAVEPLPITLGRPGGARLLG